MLQELADRVTSHCLEKHNRCKGRTWNIAEEPGLVKEVLTLYGYKIRNRTANLRRPVGRTIISNTVLSYQRGRRYSKLVVGNSPGRPSPVLSTI